MTLEAAQERHKNVGRNDLCPCESGKKYKKCHLVEDDRAILADLAGKVAASQAAADAKASEEAEAEANAKQASSKGKPGGSPTKKSTGASKGRGGSSQQAAGKSGKTDASKSLPRRGAV
jgi:hypothetical protein